MAILLKVLKRYNESIDYFDKLFPQFPADIIEVMYNKAVVLEELKRNKEALACYNEILKNNALNNFPEYNEAFKRKKQLESIV